MVTQVHRHKPPAGHSVMQKSVNIFVARRHKKSDCMLCSLQKFPQIETYKRDHSKIWGNMLTNLHSSSLRPPCELILFTRICLFLCTPIDHRCIIIVRKYRYSMFIYNFALSPLVMSMHRILKFIMIFGLK